ncbi:hypothetical protein [Pseudobacillus wudalianchiensis]|uniref:Uncharacterized protein n=1 Tax=Pseudobacillus wudalianchiensis TaxID=1743143 RepID=A0A1B9AMV6_9BACI|nr:hypothetical protein [Bacillus wudalianchiensis]OCA85247.1 hypothetical protein A8F95_11275 [Bacillus wudalianchiensis]
MSSNHTETMLKTLKDFSTCEIVLTLKHNDGTPLISVCYQKNGYQITCLKSLITETYNDIEDTISAIDKALQNSYEKTLIN